MKIYMISTILVLGLTACGGGKYHGPATDDNSNQLGNQNISTLVDSDKDGVIDSADCAPTDPDLNHLTRYFMDSDRDGFGNPNVYIDACTSLAPEDYALNATDPDDSDPFATGAQFPLPGTLAHFSFSSAVRDSAGRNPASEQNITIAPSSSLADSGNSYASFNGSSQIYIPQVSGLTGNAITVSFWVRVDTQLNGDPNQQYYANIFRAHAAPQDDFTLEQRIDGGFNRFNYFIELYNSGIEVGNSLAAISDGNWHHVVMSLVRPQNSQQPSYAKYYIDKQIALAISFGSNTPFVSSPQIWLGEGFVGGIDEVSLFGRELTFSEIEALFEVNRKAFDR